MWIVSYLLPGRKKRTLRRFPTERKARQFYTRLATRRDPPDVQSITQA